MGLIARTTKRRDIPHEPGEWMEIRRLAWAEIPPYERLTDPATRKDAILGMFVLGLTAWSYGAAITPETVRTLDTQTALWLLGEINTLNHGEDAAQSFPTASPSTATSTVRPAPDAPTSS